MSVLLTPDPRDTAVIAAAPTQPEARWAGWIQAGIMVVATLVALRHFEVPIPDSLRFIGYVAAAITVPGMLIWRAVTGRNAPLIEDLAAGTAVGYVIELLVYCAARGIGVPMLTPIWAAATIATFLLVPALRPNWRRPPRQGVGEPPRWWGWSVSAGVALLLGWSGLAWFRSSSIGVPGYAVTDTDMPYHLALIGEFKHHFPATVPWLRGEPLYYHWFVYAESAATSWGTGIEPQVLLYRLSPLPVLAATAVLIAALARRLSGTWWAGPVAVVMTYLVMAPNPYGWQLVDAFQVYGFGVIEDGALLRPTMWMSPTQTFGTLIALPVGILLVDLLRGQGHGRRTWVLFGLMLVGVMGAKATYLPIFLCGLLLVLGGWLLARRRLHRAAALAAGFVLGCLLFAQFVLFGGANQGLSFRPFETMKMAGVAGSTSLVSPMEPANVRLVLVTMLFLLCWGLVWSGAFGLRRRILEPPHLLLAGIGVAGLSGLSMLWHPGASQYFFLESARPFLGVLAACGLAAACGRPSRRLAVALVGFAAGGAALIYLVRIADGPALPDLFGPVGGRLIANTLIRPYLALVVAVVAIALTLYLARDRIPALRGAGVALVLALTTGLGLPSGLDQIRSQALAHPNGYVWAVEQNVAITPGTLEAGRWLRDHSEPDDLVATNVHCRSLPGDEICALQHFSVTAYTERRVLVEGWAYTATLNALAAVTHDPNAVPFWAPQLLAENDTAFTDPSPETVGRLRHAYGVRWLFADDLAGTPAPNLGSFATLRFRAGNCTVYEISAAQRQP